MDLQYYIKATHQKNEGRRRRRGAEEAEIRSAAVIQSLAQACENVPIVGNRDARPFGLTNALHPDLILGVGLLCIARFYCFALYPWR
jgi:hypothetical protein